MFVTNYIRRVLSKICEDKEMLFSFLIVIIGVSMIKNENNIAGFLLILIGGYFGLQKVY